MQQVVGGKCGNNRDMKEHGDVMEMKEGQGIRSTEREGKCCRGRSGRSSRILYVSVRTPF